MQSPIPRIRLTECELFPTDAQLASLRALPRTVWRASRPRRPNESAVARVCVQLRLRVFAYRSCAPSHPARLPTLPHRPSTMPHGCLAQAHRQDRSIRSALQTTPAFCWPTLRAPQDQRFHPCMEEQQPRRHEHIDREDPPHSHCQEKQRDLSRQVLELLFPAALDTPDRHPLRRTPIDDSLAHRARTRARSQTCMDRELGQLDAGQSQHRRPVEKINKRATNDLLSGETCPTMPRRRALRVQKGSCHGIA